MSWFLSARKTRRERTRSTVRRSRRAALEALESRQLLASLPYGAMPDDTAEYMLGDVRVSVVLMESDSSLSPHDTNSETWTSSAITTVKANIQAGMQWWVDTLDKVLEGTPSADRNLLNFSYDWTYADNPIHTGFEPIANPSNAFGQWIYDFLDTAGFAHTGNFSSDIRAFNNFQRQQSNTDWAFTIFVVNDTNDLDKQFAAGGSFSRAFSFAGGQFMVVPASRPDSTFAHEAGHMFWALDEYAGGSNYLATRGYYNTQNLNHALNPDPGHPSQPSVMSSGTLLDTAYGGHTSSPESLAMIGWKDSDGDGIFDVLDVPFDLTGSGIYNTLSGLYSFKGHSKVNTLPNKNSSGLQNDITINKIRKVEYAIDDGEWQQAVDYGPSGKYETDIDIAFAVPAGNHTVKIRTVDTRTGAMSPEFVGTTTSPSQSTDSGVSGTVYSDTNSNGSWDPGEVPLSDWGVEIVDAAGNPIDFHTNIDAAAYPTGTVLPGGITGVTLTAIGGDVDPAHTEVTSRPSARVPSAGSVFHGYSDIADAPVDTWTSSSRKLRIDFSQPVSRLSLAAIGAPISSGGSSVGRLEIYDSSNNLIGRYTTAALSKGQSEVMFLRRPQGDIAYAIASGHVGTEVALDHLHWGPEGAITTNPDGSYYIPDLPAGAHKVRVSLPPNYVLTGQVGDTIDVAIPAGGKAAGVNFGVGFLGSAWSNPTEAKDVNGDNFVSAIDALIIINRLNANLDPNLPDLRPAGDYFIDVNNDGFASALDALIIINHLNSSAFSPGGEGEVTTAATPPASIAGLASTGPAEGENIGSGSVASTIASPLSDAAAYYATRPFHAEYVPGDDDELNHSHSEGEASNGGVSSGDAALAIRLDLQSRATSLAAAAGDALVDGSTDKRSDEPADLLEDSLATIAADVAAAWKK